MLSKKDKKEVEQFFREYMGNELWDSLYYYQKLFLYCTPDILKTVERYKKVREYIKCLVVNKD